MIHHRDTDGVADQNEGEVGRLVSQLGVVVLQLGGYGLERKASYRDQARSGRGVDVFEDEPQFGLSGGRVLDPDDTCLYRQAPFGVPQLQLHDRLKLWRFGLVADDAHARGRQIGHFAQAGPKLSGADAAMSSPVVA